MSKKSYTDNLPFAINDFAKSNGHVHPGQEPGGPSMTRQEFRDECDINTIMAQYDQYLADPMRSIREPIYYDFTALPDSLMDAMAILHDGEAAFMSLPATVRREFDNNAAAFVDFAANPENIGQMRTWGLAPPLPTAADGLSSSPPPAPVASPAPAQQTAPSPSAPSPKGS